MRKPESNVCCWMATHESERSRDTGWYSGMRWYALPVILLLLVAGNNAAAQSFDLLAGDPPVVHHYPGADGRIGTGDDPVTPAVTGIAGSDPNVHGAYSYAVFEAFVGDPFLPGGNTAVGFAHGAVEVDPAVAAGGGGPLITGFSAVSTAFGQGHGSSTLDFLAVNGGSFNPATGAMTLDVNLEASAAGITRQFSNAMVSGTAIVLDAADFGAGSGNAYVDNVLIPRAQALNAQGLLFTEFSGTAPLDPPFVLIPAPFTVVLAALTGIPATENANLSVSKTAPAGPFAAGDQFVFSLIVENNGPADATGVMVNDPLPAGLAWVSDTCGAGPPAGGLLVWNAGTLSATQSAQCDVTVQVAAQANFDLENGATAFAAEFDPDLADNVAMTVIGTVQPGALEGLDQTPDLVTGFPSDRDCDSCPLGSQAMAENFKTESQLQLDRLTFFGGYTDNLAFTDQFQIEIRENLDSSTMPGVTGVPGALVADLTGPVTRNQTGNLIAGFFEEYQYTANAALTLPRGSYWLVIHNDSSAGSDWFWESGNADGENRSLATITANPAIPLTPRWSPNPAFNLALALAAGAPAAPPAIPALQPAGVALLLLLMAALAGWRFKQRYLTLH